MATAVAPPMNPDSVRRNKTQVQVSHIGRTDVATRHSRFRRGSRRWSTVFVAVSRVEGWSCYGQA
jgi:hypothetical protein